MDQLIIPKSIFFFILTTYLVDIVLILYGEILSWSLMGVKGLRRNPERAFFQAKQTAVGGRRGGSKPPVTCTCKNP